MSTLLLIVGLIWAALGLNNAVQSPVWHDGHHEMAGLVLVLNFVFFILPGLALAGLGKAIQSKQGGKADGEQGTAR
jgi:hypothetical protein